MADVVVFRPEDEWRGLRKLIGDPAIDVEPVERREAYQFHRDVFTLRLAYVRHPHNPTMLVPFSEYNEFVLQDKFNETLRVLTTLGASRIQCSSHRDRTRSAGVEARTPIGAFLARREGSRQSRFDYEYEGAGGTPTDPRPLRWPGEPGMEAAIDAVLRNGATSVKITVNRDDNLSASAELPVRLKRAGVDLGLHRSRGQVDTLEFHARFPDRQQEAARSYPVRASPELGQSA